MTADKITQYLEILLDMHKTLYIQETTLTNLNRNILHSVERKDFLFLKEQSVKAITAKQFYLSDLFQE